MSTQEWKNANPDKIKASRKQWYLNNRKYAISKSKERKQKIREWLQEKKKTLKCEKCEENHPSCLQFHHNDPSKKEINIAKVAEMGWSIDRIEKEISKCKVLCANHHAKLHWEENFDVAC